MKKILSFLVLGFVVFGLFACEEATTAAPTTAPVTTAAPTATTTAAPATTAAPTTTEDPYDDPATLVVQFVPSTTIDSAKLTLLKTLEDLLEAELEDAGYDINVNISVGTSYASVIEAMASGQVHLGFLTAQQYAFVTTEYPGAVEVLLTSVRDAYEVQVDEGVIITDTDVIIANANTTGYDAATTDTVKVNSYYSMLLVKTEDYAAFQAEGIDWLAGKKVGTQSPTSGSGFVYPSFLLYENDMEFVPWDQGPIEANGEVGYVTIGGHQNSVIALLNDEVDAVFTFFDARYQSETQTYFDAWQLANPTLNRFEITKVAALTIPIYNDTISGLTSLSPGLRAAIQDAFMAVIETEDGAEALSIYNHKGYLIAHDEDYDSERDLYQFLQDNS
ncbi:MAG: PhnD/SsuA/transferrin family substrate-binding protein [Candidatus Izemoplasmatales bacterium]|nr:PhnD/SsuA/transferrin family substrate-binding protein [Candidatus Izemoplasmatales bacterium]